MSEGLGLGGRWGSSRETAPHVSRRTPVDTNSREEREEEVGGIVKYLSAKEEVLEEIAGVLKRVRCFRQLWIFCCLKNFGKRAMHGQSYKSVPLRLQQRILQTNLCDF